MPTFNQLVRKGREAHCSPPLALQQWPEHSCSRLTTCIAPQKRGARNGAY